jgi:4-diphosphocytidyl-2-C-methyl-D-erythritol kinase
VRVTAPAKVNLFLGVGALRSDGYHDVVTVVHAVDLCDELLVTPSESLSLTCEPDLDLPAEKNLAFRAALAMGDEFGREPAFALALRKRIPHGAGLGGGSSDAAAVIAAIARYWDLDPAGDRCLGVARSLGADVPLFLLGGCALLQGRGDELAGTPRPIDAAIVLVKPPASVATAAAYSAFDADPQPTRSADAVLAALDAGDAAALGAALSNNMVSASSALVPPVAEAIAWVRAQPGVLGATMAGSGSAVFALCADDAAASRIARGAVERGWWGVGTRTRASGVAVND